MKKILNQVNNEKGQLYILALIVLALIVINTLTLISGALLFNQNARNSTVSLQATSLAEAGIDKAVATLNATGGNFNGEPETVLSTGSYEVKVTNLDTSTKIISATGYVPSKEDPKVKRTIEIQVTKGDGVSFGYGILAGQGGFQMSGGSRVNGSVYSNYDILTSGGATITGDAFVAGGTQPNADQQTDCTSPNCTDFIFGKAVGGNSQLDVAQSFRPATTAVINKVSLKLKKFGNPANLTVRILSDNSGRPNKNGVLASGTLSSNLVTTSYGFIDINFISPPTLTSNTPYWIVIDTSNDNTNYWAWSQDTLSGYTRGSAFWSPNWQANGTPVWNSISGDLGFKTFMGGVATRIAGTGSSYINGSAYANTLTGDNPSALQIGKDAFYQTQSNITASGQNCNSASNTHCHPGSTDPAPVTMPVSDANVADWKSQAETSVYVGNLTIQWPCTTNLEKKKYVGNVTVQGGCTIYTDSPVWITGNLTIQGGSTVRLKNTYGAASGVVVVDGTVSLAGGSKVQGSGDPNSYLMVLSTFSHPTTPAINVDGGNSSSIVYAQNGIVRLQGGAHLREATGYKIVLDGGAIVTYETGVANPVFSAGPQGSYSIIKGTYQLK